MMWNSTLVNKAKFHRGNVLEPVKTRNFDPEIALNSKGVATVFLVGIPRGQFGKGLTYSTGDTRLFSEKAQFG